MKTIQSGVLGIMAAVLSGLFVLSILSLAVLEGLITVPPTITTQPTLPNPNLTPIPVIQVTSTIIVSPSLTIPPAPTQCPAVPGWQLYIVQPGDILANLAAIHGIPLETLMDFNCLISSQLVANTMIYLPPLATFTVSVIPQSSATLEATSQYTLVCGPPPGWIPYIVKPGDTLTRISLLYRVSVFQLKQANCMNSDFLRAGTSIWVPNVATSTFTASPSPTSTQVIPTTKPTATHTPVKTATPTQTYTIIPTSTETGTPTPTATDSPSSTPTISDASTPTPTATHTKPPPL